MTSGKTVVPLVWSLCVLSCDLVSDPASSPRAALSVHLPVTARFFAGRAQPVLGGGQGGLRGSRADSCPAAGPLAAPTGPRLAAAPH